MNETFVDAMNLLIQKTLTGVDNTITFLSAQIPDVLRQLITFNIVKESISILVLFIPIIIYITTLAHINKQKKNKNKGSIWIDKYTRDEVNYNEAAQALAILGGFIMVGCSLSVIDHVLNLAELVFAPKVWLLEYASNLIKSVKH